ncbi:hypothetical protein [Amycolatopsis sp. NPDC004625]|uniref:hypothetical protein n=1 Tax=Amycolatopsis sp. NPDC004625 TaxID=3154670 RepID=UPI0033AD0F11
MSTGATTQSQTAETRAAIARHLVDVPAVDGQQYRSSFNALLGDARHAAGRDTTGLLVRQSATLWLGATAYLVLLDQIGKTFTLADFSIVQSRPAINQALACFTDLDSASIEALYALRCSLAHDYSLASPSKRPERTHLFRLAHDEHTPLVTFPQEPWPNDYSVVRGHNTLVNLRKIGDLVEGVVDRLRREHADDRLRLHPELSLVEFETRYGLYFRVDV